MPLNPDEPTTTRDRATTFRYEHYVLINQVALALALAFSFTIMGTPPVALGIMIGLVLVLAVGSVR